MTVTDVTVARPPFAIVVVKMVVSELEGIVLVARELEEDSDCEEEDVEAVGSLEEEEGSTVEEVEVDGLEEEELVGDEEGPEVELLKT